MPNNKQSHHIIRVALGLIVYLVGLINSSPVFRNHTSSWPFLNPVDRKAVPDYYEHVKFPMDMKTMAERLKANYYVNKRLFIADMKRMFTNCRSALLSLLK